MIDVEKYSEDQPRDEQGRWTSGGGGEVFSGPLGDRKWGPKAMAQRQAMIGLMQRPDGATAAEIIQATGWKNVSTDHLWAMRRDGYEIAVSRNAAGERVYKITAAPDPNAPRPVPPAPAPAPTPPPPPPAPAPAPPAPPPAPGAPRFSDPPPFGTPRDAERWLKSELGVRYPDMDNDVRVAGLVAAGLAKAAQEGIRMPTQIKIAHGRGKTIASYNNLADLVTIKHQNRYWQNPEQEARREERMGWHAAGHPHEAIFHELGHREHSLNAPAQYSMYFNRRLGRLNPREKAVASGVSRYAMANRHEFVAEVFSGIHGGKTYGPDVMNLYRFFGGKEPRRA